MSTLTQGGEHPFTLIGRSTRIPEGHKAQFKRIALRTLAVMTMGSVLTALIALKTAIYVWHLHA